MGVYLRDNMGCMTDFGYVILDTNLPTFMTIQACSSTITNRIEFLLESGLVFHRFLHICQI